MTVESPAALVAALSRDLSETQRVQLAALLELVVTDELAPTAIRDPERVRDEHLADSLSGLEIKALRGAAQIADVGAGAGFPGLALASALPSAEVFAVESRGRACEFLVRAREAAGLKNAHVVQARAEEWCEGIERNDAVVARALAPQAVVLEYAAPLLKSGGTLVDWRGARSDAAERAALAAATMLGLERVEIRRVEPFAGARARHLHVFTKTGVTPSRFPRRAGVAHKRPLAS
jgi:16S rRNA (guanine527-N7)-methyltransferase